MVTISSELHNWMQNNDAIGVTLDKKSISIVMSPNMIAIPVNFHLYDGHESVAIVELTNKEVGSILSARDHLIKNGLNSKELPVESIYIEQQKESGILTVCDNYASPGFAVSITPTGSDITSFSDLIPFYMLSFSYNVAIATPDVVAYEANDGALDIQNNDNQNEISYNMAM